MKTKTFFALLFIIIIPLIYYYFINDPDCEGRIKIISQQLKTLTDNTKSMTKSIDSIENNNDELWQDFIKNVIENASPTFVLTSRSDDELIQLMIPQGIIKFEMKFDSMQPLVANTEELLEFWDIDDNSAGKVIYEGNDIFNVYRVEKVDNEYVNVLVGKCTKNDSNSYSFSFSNSLLHLNQPIKITVYNTSKKIELLIIN